MNKKRLEAYRNLIDALLNSNEREELELLQAHSELLDANFFQVMEEVAQELKEKGNQERADFLVYLAEALVYQGIIAQLLNCASVDEALQILEANRDWVDVGLQQTMLEVAEVLRTQGDLDKSNFLMNIVEQLMEVHEHTSDAQRNFLLQVLQTTADSDGDPQVVYPLLLANVDKLDAKLSEQLWIWAKKVLVNVDLDKAKSIARVISIFSNLIQQFPIGDKANNIEIAITGYKIFLSVYTPELSPLKWAGTQNSLGIAYLYRIKGDKADNLEQAITYFQNTLKIVTFEAFPSEWAGTQNNLGLAYYYRIKGDRAENLEQAGACYQNALKIVTFEAFPSKWAGTQHNLGLVYSKRIRGNKADNLERTLACYQNALKVRSFETFPLEWAQTQNNLAIAYAERIRGNKAENLERTLACCKNALKVITFETLPQDWAQAQNNLANVYSKRSRGDKAENLERAIACYQNALKVITLEALPQDWAQTQSNLANADAERIRGNKAENLERAIACYQNALKVITFEALPQDWAGIQNNLGRVYAKRIRGNKAKNLERAIACYQNVLKVKTFEALPQNWAGIQMGLGNVYLEKRLEQKGEEHLKRALAYLQNALKVYTFEAFPQYWAQTQANLGIVYLYKTKGDRADNLEQAISRLQQALKILTFESFPQDWARAENALGIAYTNRVKGDKAENLEQAISYHQNALKVYTYDNFPQDWSVSKNALGIAYTNRVKGDKAENLEQAISCYQQALKVRTYKAFTKEWAETQHNLGAAYGDRIREDKAENLERAISCYQQALKIRTAEIFPKDWIISQNGLGIVYIQRVKGDRAENLEQALAYFQKALKNVTIETFPQDWAMTQLNLGFAYYYRIKGDSSENLERAIACYQNALKVYTYEIFPKNHAETLMYLGIAYQKINQFALAHTTFESAITTIESLREEILSGEESKRKQAEHFNQAYSRMVEVCLKLSNIKEAIEYVERSKTRNLVEQILNRDLKTIFPPEVVTQLEQYRDEIAPGQYQIQHGKAENPTALAQELQELRQKRNELQNSYLPIGSGFQFEHFQNNLDEHTAIVEFYFTEDKLLTFIFTCQTQQPKVLQSEPKDLGKLGKWLYGYFSAYYNKPSYWQRRLNTRLHLLAKILHIDEIIQQIPPDCDRLIFIPHRYLHLFPLHALPINSQQEKAESEILMHRFPAGVSYAPSCQILELTETRKRLEFQRLFAIVNPTPDLYEKYEADLGAVKAISQQFDNRLILKKDKAKKSEILQFDEQTKTLKENEELLLAHCAFFFCHGYFNPNSPLDSGLQLADDNLTLVDIIAHFNLENCRLVTLSACETGITDPTQISDEYIGLPYGFLLAGSTNVISSLWTVSAAATALLMIKFYEELQQQNNITVALNTAQAWLRDTTSQGFQNWLKNSSLSSVWRRELEGYFAENYSDTTKPFESPFYWSAFFVAGKGV
ncbi:MAG: tetratricopeptide repeat protein [Xenococcaceae cyanobacterium MO_207.B15]|nr:tetratricopeptide repeat protein [Xenococcaceae cyanobacterium MO_207.B15]